MLIGTFGEVEFGQEVSFVVGVGFVLVAGACRGTEVSFCVDGHCVEIGVDAAEDVEV